MRRKWTEAQVVPGGARRSRMTSRMRGPGGGGASGFSTDAGAGGLTASASGGEGGGGGGSAFFSTVVGGFAAAASASARGPILTVAAVAVPLVSFVYGTTQEFVVLFGLFAALSLVIAAAGSLLPRGEKAPPLAPAGSPAGG